MTKPRLLVLSLGGTITMVPSEAGGIAPRLGAAALVASVPALAEVAEIEAHSPFRLPSPSLTPGNLVEVARTIEEGFASGFDGAVVIQGTDTIEEFRLHSRRAGRRREAGRGHRRDARGGCAGRRRVG